MESLHRRDFLKKTAGVAIATFGFPAILTAKNKYPTIRILGTHVTLQDAIREQAQKDLKINVEFYPGGSSEILTKAIANPKSFDIYEQWSNSTRLLWDSGSIQALDTKKLTYWDEINSLPKFGKISPSAKAGAGDIPNKILYVQQDKTLGATPTDKISFMPYVHNVDSFGYNSSIIKEGVPYETESWAWLLDERYRGKVAIVNEPTIGLFDLALAAEAKGLARFRDMGNMSIQEIDKLFEIVYKYKNSGQFRGFWNSVPHSIDLMKNGEVDIESMFSPAVSTLNGEGIPCLYAAPKEGYRAWYGVMSLSSEVNSEQKDAAYAYMNWWLSGWAGAFIARQGYYISNPQRSKPLMSQAEWDYWYEGKVASMNLLGTDNKISVKKGTYRRGGSYTQRFENVAVWNTVMPNFDYTLKKWHKLVRQIN
jgi:putative spermidine/putrescine transport system substrate-binding protein